MNKKTKTNEKPETEAPEIHEKEEQEIDERQLEIDNLKNQLARALADYQNQQKRFNEERSQIFTYASERIVENLIPVLDILEKAQEHLNDQGLGMAISEFKRVLKDEGLEEIKPMLHNPFDHETMEVVESVEAASAESYGEPKEGTVAETVFSGWKFKDGKVVRYAKVKVFSGEAN